MTYMWIVGIAVVLMLVFVVLLIEHEWADAVIFLLIVFVIGVLLYCFA